MIRSVSILINWRRAFWLYLVTPFGLALLFANQSSAQLPVDFEFGLRAGIPFHNIVESRFFTPFSAASIATVENSERPWIAVGPTFGALLYDQVQVELGAIYKPVRFETNRLGCANGDCSQSVTGVAVHESVRGHLWEFPLTANYYFGHNRIRPYAAAALSQSHTSEISAICGIRTWLQETRLSSRAL
jgi:hypothetical protein